MTSRRLGSVLSLFVLVVTACNRIDVAPRPMPTGPSVLLVTIDTLRGDHVGPREGQPSATPTLDRLAAGGAVFTNAMATVPLTLPSHTSILTGLYPPSHAVRHNGIHKLAPEIETATQRFQAAGYATGAFVAATVLDSAFGLDRGFDTYDDRMSRKNGAVDGVPEVPAAEMTDKALAWLSQADRPFFAWVHYYDPHFSYAPPEPYRARFADDPYRGEIAYVDAELGRLLDGLRAAGRDQQTLVVVTSDHGESLMEHDEKTHSYLIYEAATHVPLILAGPGVPKGTRVEEVVSNAAIAPTILAAAKLPPLARTDVDDLLPAARAEAGTANWAYSETLAGQFDHGWAPIHAIRSANRRYIRAPQPELYALDRDPGERTNLLPTQEAPLAADAAAANARLDALLLQSSTSVESALDAETRAQIEALGYVVPYATHRTAPADAPNPRDVVKYSQLEYAASALIEAGRLEEAEELTLFALTKLPRSFMLADKLTQVYLETDRVPLAVETAARAAELSPTNPLALSFLGDVKRRANDISGAVAAYERALTLDPGNAAVHFALLSKLRAGGTLDEALEHERLGLDAARRTARAFEQCGQGWEAAGDYARAIASYERGAEEGSGDRSRLHMRLATHALRAGDSGGFEEHIARAGEAARDRDLATRLAVVLAVRHEPARAEAILRFVAMRDPTDSTRRVLAKVLREHGRAADAERLVPASSLRG